MQQIKGYHTFKYEKAAYGLKLMAWGFFKKMAIADVLAHYVDLVFASPQNYRTIDLIMTSLFFTIQIYCDFSGYSDIAIGTAKLLDIDLMTNFRSPYFSCSIKEFWARWHISLSTWFRDYVYIPLGGNRVSKIRHSLNLFITFMVSGLWHGANWTFLVWGGGHGLLQIIENNHRDKLKRFQENKLGKIVSIIVVFSICNILWIFFRADSVSSAFYFIKRIFCVGENLLKYSKEQLNLSEKTLIVTYFNIFVMTIFDFYSLRRNVIAWISERNIIFRWCIYLLFVWLIILGMPTASSEFIYFQF